ncbi:tetratricopeptide-like helical domain, DYW domain protein [Tanacetum coccineum]
MIVVIRGSIICPCLRCCNDELLEVEEVHDHLLRYGFLPGYTIWTIHGELATPPTSQSTSVHETSFVKDDMIGLVRDAFGLSYSTLNHENTEEEMLDGEEDESAETSDHNGFVSAIQAVVLFMPFKLLFLLFPDHLKQEFTASFLEEDHRETDVWSKATMKQACKKDEYGSILRVQNMTEKDVYKLTEGEKVLVHVNIPFQCLIKVLQLFRLAAKKLDEANNVGDTGDQGCNLLHNLRTPLAKKTKHKRSPNRIEFFDLSYQSRDGSFIHGLVGGSLMERAREEMTRRELQISKSRPVDDEVRSEIAGELNESFTRLHLRAIFWLELQDMLFQVTSDKRSGGTTTTAAPTPIFKHICGKVSVASSSKSILGSDSESAEIQQSSADSMGQQVSATNMQQNPLTGQQYGYSDMQQDSAYPSYGFGNIDMQQQDCTKKSNDAFKSCGFYEKLLGVDVKIGCRLLVKLAFGTSLSGRDKQQLTNLLG